MVYATLAPPRRGPSVEETHSMTDNNCVELSARLYTVTRTISGSSPPAMSPAQLYRSQNLKAARFSGDLTYLVGYTWWKATDTTSGIRPRGAIRYLRKTNSAFNAITGLRHSTQATDFVSSARRPRPVKFGPPVRQGGYHWTAHGIASRQTGS